LGPLLGGNFQAGGNLTTLNAINIGNSLMIVQTPQLDLRTLLSLAERKAQRDYEGHIILIRTSEHWQIQPGNSALNQEEQSSHELLEEALLYFIIG